MEVLKAFGKFVVDLATSVDNLAPAIKKDLYPFAALILTILFVRAHYTAHYRRTWKTQRKAALQNGVPRAEIQQVRFSIVGPVVLAVFLGFAYFYAFSGPQAAGLFTAPQVLSQKLNNTRICENAMRTGDFALAEKAVRNKTVGLSLFRSYKQDHFSMASLVGSLANFCIIYTGAMFSILPFLGLMVVHTVLSPFRYFFNNSIWGLNTRFFDVVIPVVNIVTVLSLLVFFVFHLLVDTWRAENCLWTSGHWYTYVITTLCFFFVLTHLMLNEPERLAVPYVVWFALQQFLSFSALRETQMFFHNVPEALDGVRYALLLFPLLALVGGYIARRQCLPPSVSPLEAAKRAEPLPGVSDLATSNDKISAPPAPALGAPGVDDQKTLPENESASGEDYVHVSSRDVAPSSPPPAPPLSPTLSAPSAPPLAPDDLPVPKPEPSTITRRSPKPPGGPSEPLPKSSTARFDPSELGQQIKNQREKMRKTAKTEPERPLDGLALQLRNIRAMINPDAGLEQEANEEEWID